MTRLGAKRLLGCALALSLISSTAIATESQWTTTLDLRYRLETVDDDRFDRDATASTLRLRAGLISPRWSGFDFGVTGHANRSIFRERFNSTANGKTNFPVVADPDDEGVSEAWVRYQHENRIDIRVGRQRINEDNQRFIGAVGFRQLEQTFDAATFRYSVGKTTFEARRIEQANRIFGRSNPNPLLAELDLDTWTARIDHDFGNVKAGLFFHRFAFDDRPASHRNLGLRLNGQVADGSIDWRAEFARQEGLRELSDVSGQNYYHLRVAQRLDGWHWFGGFEKLEGDGEYSFQTPLATLHAFNGWNDQFLVTPGSGLSDVYVAAGTRLGGWTGLFKAHHFRSDKGNDSLGNEFGLMASTMLPTEIRFEAKLAWFKGDSERADVLKTWWTLSRQW